MRFPRRQFVASLISLALVPFTRRKERPDLIPGRVLTPEPRGVKAIVANVPEIARSFGLEMPPKGVVTWNGEPVDGNALPDDLVAYLKCHEAEAREFNRIARRAKRWDEYRMAARALRGRMPPY